MGEDAANYGYLADLENLQSLLETLTSGHGKEAMAELTQAQKNEAGLRKEVQQLQAELEGQRKIVQFTHSRESRGRHYLV